MRIYTLPTKVADIAQVIIDLAWRNEIDTYGLDAAEVNTSNIQDYIDMHLGRYGDFSALSAAKKRQVTAKVFKLV